MDLDEIRDRRQERVRKRLRQSTGKSGSAVLAPYAIAALVVAGVIGGRALIRPQHQEAEPSAPETLNEPTTDGVVSLRTRAGDTPTLSITSAAILLDAEPVVQLAEGELVKSDLSSDGTIKPIMQRLASRDGLTRDAVIIVSRNTPFRVLRAVEMTVRRAGYSEVEVRPAPESPGLKRMEK